MRVWAFLACLGLLTACGSAADGPLAEFAKIVTPTGAQQKGPPPTIAQQRAALIARVKASGSTQPVLLVELPKQGAVASLSVAGQNAGATSWFDPTGVSVVTRRGVVIATRGLGFDLMSSDTRGTLAALRGGGSSYTRAHRYLNGEGQAVDLVFTCDVSRSGAQVQESCTSGETRFTNSYTLRGGEAVSSRQWLGPDIGYANVSRLQ